VVRDAALADYPTLIATVILVSASGALAPGPLTFYAFLEGARSGVRGGLATSVGHTLVEFPYVIALAVGLQALLGAPIAHFWITLIGGGVLIVFGAFQMYAAFAGRDGQAAGTRRKVLGNAVIMGAVFTGLNPFFLIWWLTIGSKLVFDALVLASIVGVVVMYGAHVWLDYAFLGTAAYLSKKGVNLVGARGYRFVLMFLAAVLIYFGGVFIASVV